MKLKIQAEYHEPNGLDWDKFKNDVITVDKKYNGKTINLGDHCWGTDGDYIEEKLSKNQYDPDIVKIEIDVDRGVWDWKIFGELIRKKYPNVKYVEVSQNFGGSNFEESGFELLIVYDVQTFSGEGVKPKTVEKGDCKIVYHNTKKPGTLEVEYDNRLVVYYASYDNSYENHVTDDYWYCENGCSGGDNKCICDRDIYGELI